MESLYSRLAETPDSEEKPTIVAETASCTPEIWSGSILSSRTLFVGIYAFAPEERLERRTFTRSIRLSESSFSVCAIRKR